MSKFGGIPVEEAPVDTGSKFGGVAVADTPTPVKEDKFAGLMDFQKEQKQKMQEFTKELTTRDPSKAGQVTGEQALEKIKSGAMTGAAIGGGVGAFGGPAAAVGGAVMGGLGGAVGGGLSALAQQMGYGEKTQQLADMIGMGVVPAQAGIKMIAENKLVQQSSNLVSDLAKSMIPKYGTLRKVASFFLKLKFQVQLLKRHWVRKLLLQEPLQKLVMRLRLNYKLLMEKVLTSTNYMKMLKLDMTRHCLKRLEQV